MRQCDDETRHSLTPPSVCTFVNFIDANKSAFTPPADRKIVPCLGKNCALPRKIFFLLIPAKAPSPSLSQKYKNIFTSNITLTPATCKGTHIFRLEFLFLSSFFFWTFQIFDKKSVTSMTGVNSATLFVDSESSETNSPPTIQILRIEIQILRIEIQILRIEIQILRK